MAPGLAIAHRITGETALCNAAMRAGGDKRESVPVFHGNAETLQLFVSTQPRTETVTRFSWSCSGSIPDESDLLQRLLLEDLDAFGDITTTLAGVEGKRVLVLFQRPHHEAIEAMIGKFAAGG